MKKHSYLVVLAYCTSISGGNLVMAADLVNDIIHVKGVIENTGGTSSPELTQAQDLLDQAIAIKEAGGKVKAQELIDQGKALLA